MVPRDPVDPWIPPKECSLSLGQTHRGTDCILPALAESNLPGNDRDELLVANGLASSSAKTRHQLRHLVEETGVQHGIEPRGNPCGKCVAGVDPDPDERTCRVVVTHRGGRRTIGAARRGGSGEPEDFHGADHPSRVGQVDHIGCGSIGGDELIHQVFPWHGFQLSSEPVVGRWEFERVHQGTQMEPRSSSQDRRSALIGEPIEHDRAFLLEPGDAQFFRWIHQVNEVVSETGTRLRIGFRGADVHFPIGLHRVDRDDVGAETRGERLGEM